VVSMGIYALRPEGRQLMDEFAVANSELQAVYIQKEKNEQVVKEIDSLISDMQSKKIKEVLNIVGGTLIIKSPDIQRDINVLKKRRDVFRVAVEALDAQIKNREDDLAERALKFFAELYRVLYLQNGDPLEQIKHVIDDPTANGKYKSSRVLDPSIEKRMSKNG